jgi:hypothetical protein
MGGFILGGRPAKGAETTIQELSGFDVNQVRAR